MGCWFTTASMTPNCIEAVPNFSEGRNPKVIRALIQACGSVPGAVPLDHTSDPDHNRTVLTVAGEPSAVAKAVFEAVATAVDLIRLPEHDGVHPRIGVADVIPFIPVRGVTLNQCATLARDFAQRLWQRLQVPVFLYEAAAYDPARARLETIRSRSFSGHPDFGTGRHRTAGASVVGARPFLVAWNINLLSPDLAAARAIARYIRESSGGLPAVKALGLELRSRKQVQVSINLTDFERTPLHVIFEQVQTEAAARGIAIAGSELVGLIPRRALELSDGHDLHWLVGSHIADFVLETRLARLLPDFER